MSTRISVSREFERGVTVRASVKTTGMEGGDGSRHEITLDSLNGCIEFDATDDTDHRGHSLRISAHGDWELEGLADAFAFIAQALRLACPASLTELK